MAPPKKYKTPQGETLAMLIARRELDVLWQIVMDVTGNDFRPETPSRKRYLVNVRKLFYAFAYRTRRFTHKQLATYTGKANHTTIIHHVQEVEDLCAKNPLGKPYDPDLYRQMGLCEREYAAIVDVKEQPSNYTAKPRYNRWLTAGYL